MAACGDEETASVRVRVWRRRKRGEEEERAQEVLERGSAEASGRVAIPLFAVLFQKRGDTTVPVSP